MKAGFVEVNIPPSKVRMWFVHSQPQGSESNHALDASVNIGNMIFAKLKLALLWFMDTWDIGDKKQRFEYIHSSLRMLSSSN